MLKVANKPIMLNVIMLNVIMLNVILLNVNMLNDVVLSVVAPMLRMRFSTLIERLFFMSDSMRSRLRLISSTISAWLNVKGSIYVSSTF